MCGILGIIRDHIDREELIRANNKMLHRGPDGAGCFIDRNVGIAHRRLSIIDVAGGYQPLSNEDGSIWITFNGEIYNYIYLKERLISKGHRFKTNSDTEAIVHLYEEKGVDCVHDLEGMFAFAIWDKKNNRLFAARDRLGEKPFYYFQSSKVFAFASEIKALLEFKEVTREINLGGIEEYFTFKYLAGENTLFKDIYNLLPGHFLVFQDNHRTIRKYWDLSNDKVEENKSLSDLELKYSLLLHHSVNQRLMSEVPLGTFNSGGIDSSLITAMTSQKINSSINSFSIGFNESDYDESIYAEMISRQYNTTHHPLKITNSTFSENLPKAIWLNDEPLNHPNSVMIYLLSKLSKEFVTVVLTGEGADELLGGYPRYIILKLLQKYRNTPNVVRWMVRKVIQSTHGRKVQKIKDNLDLSFNDAIINNSVNIGTSISGSLLNENLLSGKFERRVSYLTDPPITQDLQRLFYYEIKTYLVSILNRADKMTMGASIEARPPFLDHRCVEFCYRLPLDFRYHKFQTKFFLKKYSQKYLPSKIINRKKSGFGVPLREWIRDQKGLGRYLDLLKSDDFRSSGLFNNAFVGTLIKQHLTGKTNHGEILWELINFQLWKQIFFDSKHLFII